MLHEDTIIKRMKLISKDIKSKVLELDSLMGDWNRLKDLKDKLYPDGEMHETLNHQLEVNHELIKVTRKYEGGK